MVQTLLDKSLCIAEETPQGRHMVFPSQYRREKDIPRDPDIFVSYTFSGEWQTVWTTLVVRLRYCQEFEHRELWRNAAEFASNKSHMMAICGEANQIFRELAKFDDDIDCEVEFKDNDGKASGKKIYVQLKSGNSYLRARKGDGSEVFDVKNERHLQYWMSQPQRAHPSLQAQEISLRSLRSLRWI